MALDLHVDVQELLARLFRLEGDLVATISTKLKEQDVYSMDDLRGLSKEDMTTMNIKIGPRNRIWNEMHPPLPDASQPSLPEAQSAVPDTQASVPDTHTNRAGQRLRVSHSVRLVSHTSCIRSGGADTDNGTHRGRPEMPSKPAGDRRATMSRLNRMFDCSSAVPFSNSDAARRCFEQEGDG
jgi:hypothetical protein